MTRVPREIFEAQKTYSLTANSIDKKRKKLLFRGVLFFNVESLNLDVNYN